VASPLTNLGLTRIDSSPSAPSSLLCQHLCPKRRDLLQSDLTALTPRTPRFSQNTVRASLFPRLSLTGFAYLCEGLAAR